MVQVQVKFRDPHRPFRVVLVVLWARVRPKRSQQREKKALWPEMVLGGTSQDPTLILQTILYPIMIR